MLIDFRGTPLEIVYTYHKPYRGYRDSYGCPMEPDEPACIEIDTIIYKDKDILELCDSAGILEEIEGLVMEALEQEHVDYLVDQAEYYRDQREDR